MGEFLLREYRQADPDFELAWPLSVSVIEKVIDNVDGCGRPTWVGVSWPMPESIASQYKLGGQKYSKTVVAMMQRSEIDPLVPELQKAETHLSQSRNKEMRKVLERVFKKYRAAVARERKKAEEEGS